MMRLRYLLVPLLFLFTSTAFAVSIFDSPPTDLSIQFLKMIFGNVPNVLRASGSDLLQGVLLDFNHAVLVLGGIVILYSLTVSTVNTANEGEMLGRNWNSVWIPMRAAGGFALLMPVKGGYALIQVFVMWVVVQGVGAANYIWIKNVDRLASGQVTTSLVSTTGAEMSAANIFNSIVCTAEVTKSLRYSNPFMPLPYIPDITPPSDKNDNYLQFGVSSLSPKDICGAVKFNDLNVQPSANPMDVLLRGASGTSTVALQDAEQRYNQKINDAILNMVKDLYTLADKYMAMMDASGSLDDDQVNEIQNGLKQAADDYIEEVNAIDRGTSNSSKYQKELDFAKGAGWILAGSFYLTLNEMNEEMASTGVDGPKTKPYDQNKLKNYFDGAQLDDLMSILNYSTSTVTTPVVGSVDSVSDVSDFFDKGLIGPITDAYAWMLTGWMDLLTGAGTVKSPILKIQTLGVWMAHLTIGLYVAFAVAMVAAAGFLYVASFVNSAGFALSTLLNLLLTPLSVLAGIFIVQGFIMGYYIPSVPFIVFTLTAIGWLIYVLEAMVAAPLLALGILHPEGQHAVFGRGEAGIMLLAGVFLRPPLMIVGLFASIALSYVVVMLISIGFIPLFYFLVGLSPFGLIAMTTIYTMLIMVGINRSFTIIHYIPDRVMRWIGQPAEQTQIEQEMAQVRGAAESTGGKFSEGGSEFTSGQTSALKTLKADREKAKAEAEKEDTGTGKIK